MPSPAHPSVRLAVRTRAAGFSRVGTSQSSPHARTHVRTSDRSKPTAPRAARGLTKRDATRTRRNVRACTAAARTYKRVQDQRGRALGGCERPRRLHDPAGGCPPPPGQAVRPPRLLLPRPRAAPPTQVTQQRARRRGAAPRLIHPPPAVRESLNNELPLTLLSAWERALTKINQRPETFLFFLSNTMHVSRPI